MKESKIFWAIVIVVIGLFVIPLGNIIGGITGQDPDRANAVATLISFDSALAGKNNCPDNVDDQDPQRGKACIQHLGHWQEVSCNALPAHTTEGWPGHDWVDPVGKKNCGGGQADPTATAVPVIPTATPKPTEVPPTAEPTEEPNPTAQPTAVPTDDGGDDDDGDDGDTDDGDDKEKVAQETVVATTAVCETPVCYCVQLVLDWLEEHILPRLDKYLNIQQDRNTIMEKWEFVAP